MDVPRADRIRWGARQIRLSRRVMWVAAAVIWIGVWFMPDLAGRVLMGVGAVVVLGTAGYGFWAVERATKQRGDAGDVRD